MAGCEPISDQEGSWRGDTFQMDLVDLTVRALSLGEELSGEGCSSTVASRDQCDGLEKVVGWDREREAPHDLQKLSDPSSEPDIVTTSASSRQASFPVGYRRLDNARFS